MTAIAVTASPWRRWWRYHRRQGTFRPSTTPAKPWNGFVLFGVLVALDQATKHTLTTPEWGWHQQPTRWTIYPLIGIALFSVFLTFPRTRTAAATVISGCVGNLVSHLTAPAVANPFVTGWGQGHVAFNLADVYLLTGFALVVVHSADLIRTRRHTR